MDPIFQAISVVFFGVFQAFGGVWFGTGLRAAAARSLRAVGLIGSGVMFAGVATFMSAYFLRVINPWLFGIGLGILAISLLAGVFFPRDYSQEIGAGTIIAIGLGGSAAIIGSLVVVKGVQSWSGLAFEDIVFGALLGGCWITIGLAFFLSGVGALLRGKALELRPGRGRSMEIVATDQKGQEKRKAKQKNRHQ